MGITQWKSRGCCFNCMLCDWHGECVFICVACWGIKRVPVSFHCRRNKKCCQCRSCQPKAFCSWLGLEYHFRNIVCCECSWLLLVFACHVCDCSLDSYVSSPETLNLGIPFFFLLVTFFLTGFCLLQRTVFSCFFS